MSKIYLKDLSIMKKRITQQIIDTKGQLRSLEKTLAKLNENEKNFVNNHEKFRQLNAVFDRLTRVCKNYNGADCPCLNEFGICQFDGCTSCQNNIGVDNKKREYMRIGFNNAQLSESEIQFLREYLPLFTNAVFTVWPARNFITNDEKQFLVTNGFTITNFTK